MPESCRPLSQKGMKCIYWLLSPEVRVKTMKLLVGTLKGGFILESNSSRRTWKLHGPFFDGFETYDMVGDTSGDKPVLYAAVNTWTWGPVIYKSLDSGKSWKRAKSSPRFAKNNKKGLAVKRIWNIQPDGKGKVYAGVEPAALFVSDDESDSWRGFEGLNYHETREKWSPGNGGLCLHTIVLHPQDGKKIRVGVSSVGVIGSDDGGKKWRFMNKGIRADFLPNKYPEYGQCVHKIDFHPSEPDTLYLQNHGGVYTSKDFGENWREISKGLPSDFGFPIGVNRSDPDTAYVVPVIQMGRFPTDGKFQIWVTRNGGKKWEPSDKGLPRQAYFGVLREAMAIDNEQPGGVYCGTTTGQVFYTRDDGGSWGLMAENLPRITSLSALSN
jgi:phage pi2 protein 07